MSEHTKEPWSLYEEKGDRPCFHINQKDGAGWIAELPLVQHRSEECRANSRRIVACVNACEGIATETLEQQFAGRMLVGSGVQLWMNYTDKKAEVEDLKQQRDELLAASEKAVSEMKATAWDEEGYCLDPDLDESADELAAAIAKVKP